MLQTTTLPRFGQYLLFAALACGLASAQMTTTGSVTGTVIDASGHAIAGAKVTLISDRTSESRTATTNEAGDFNMIAVQPDTYNLRIEQKGFKVHEKRGFVVAANDRVALADITLQVGEVTETV